MAEKKPPIADDPERLTAAARRLREALSKDRLLCCEHVADDRLQDGIAYWIEPSGKRADPTAARELIRKGKLQPAMGGLLDGHPQAWMPT